MKLDPVMRLVLQTLSELIEKDRAMSAEIDRLNANVADISAAVTTTTAAIETLVGKLSAIVPVDPAETAAIAAAADSLATLSQTLRDAVSKAGV